MARNLKEARERAGFTQEEAAARSGFSKQAISGWERGAYTPTEANLQKIAELYGSSEIDLRYGNPTEADLIAQMRVAEKFAPNPLLRKRLRPAPYARVYAHLQQMMDVGCSTEQIEEAERLMIDGAYNKLNARDPRDRSDEEMIMDIDDAWDWIKEVLGRSGVKGL